MVMGKKTLIAGVVVVFCLLCVSQSGRLDNPGNTGSPFSGGDASSLPPELLRPQYGEEPHFPQDYVIGTLGRGDASEESYRYARLIVAGLASGNGKTDGVGFPEQKRQSVLRNISGLGTRGWRVGGGRVEPDGSVSYLIRFLGREKSVTGELYLRREGQEPGFTGEKEMSQGAIQEEGGSFWQVDDILLESPRSLSDGKFGPGRTEMTAYERFF